MCSSIVFYWHIYVVHVWEALVRLVWDFNCLHFALYISISQHGIDCKHTWCKRIYCMKEPADWITYKNQKYYKYIHMAEHVQEPHLVSDWHWSFRYPDLWTTSVTSEFGGYKCMLTCLTAEKQLCDGYYRDDIKAWQTNKNEIHWLIGAWAATRL